MISKFTEIELGNNKKYVLETTREVLRLRGLPKALYDATVVHLTDFHGGFGNTDLVLHEAIQQANAADPDIVLLTGDYIDDHKTIKDYPIHDTLRPLQARLGVYGSYGNHDHQRGLLGTQCKLEQAGVQVLCNNNICIENGLWLAGLDDIYNGKPDIEATFHGIPEHVTPIVLSHSPRLIEYIPDRHVQILSGHTHGAQICLPFPTPKMICRARLHCRQVAGWYYNGHARLYVNRGIGVTKKPFRYRCPAEVAIFRLVPDPY